MAKIDFDFGSLLPHGKVAGMVWRRTKRGLSAYPLPDFSKRKYTDKQKAERARFKRCVPVAHVLMHDPQQRARCERLAEQKHWPVWNAAMSIARQSVH